MSDMYLKSGKKVPDSALLMILRCSSGNQHVHLICRKKMPEHFSVPQTSSFAFLFSFFFLFIFFLELNFQVMWHRVFTTEVNKTKIMRASRASVSFG